MNVPTDPAGSVVTGFLLWYVLRLERFTNAEAFATMNVFGLIPLLPARIPRLRLWTITRARFSATAFWVSARNLAWKRFTRLGNIQCVRPCPPIGCANNQPGPGKPGLYIKTTMEELKDGICPECGAELKFSMTNGHELNDGDYLTPNTYVVDSYIYKCPDCGATYETKNEL